MKNLLLDKFRKTSAELKDTSLRRFALQAIPVIQMHLNAIDSISRVTGYKPME